MHLCLQRGGGRQSLTLRNKASFKLLLFSFKGSEMRVLIMGPRGTLKGPWKLQKFFEISRKLVERRQGWPLSADQGQPSNGEWQNTDNSWLKKWLTCTWMSSKRWKPTLESKVIICLFVSLHFNQCIASNVCTLDLILLFLLNYVHNKHSFKIDIKYA